MTKARKFIQPMLHTGLPNTPGWAGYEYLQWTGSVHHPGLDYNWGYGEQDKGKPVFAIATGLVEKAIYWNGTTEGFGNHIFIKHILESTGKTVYSHYCHLDTITVKEGQEVQVGQEIGTCGGTGGWPSHLHLEIRKPTGKGYNFWPKKYSPEWIADNYFDPYQFIKDRKGEVMGNSPIMYNGYDLSNQKSMKVAVDVLNDLMDGLYVEAKKYDKEVERAIVAETESARLRGEIEVEKETFAGNKESLQAEIKRQQDIAKGFYEIVAMVASQLDTTQDFDTIEQGVGKLVKIESDGEKAVDKQKENELETSRKLLKLQGELQKFEERLRVIKDFKVKELSQKDADIILESILMLTNALIKRMMMIAKSR